LSKPAAPLRRRGRLVQVIVALAATGLFVLAYQWGSQYRSRDEAPPAIDGALIDPPAPLPDARLRPASSEPDEPVSLRDSGGTAWLLFAIPGPHPQRLSQALERLVLVYNGMADRAALRDALRLALITAREPDARARAVGRMANLMLLRGDEAAVATLRTDLGLGAAGNTAEGPLLLLADADGRLRAVFSELQSPSSIATDLKALLEHAGLGGTRRHDR